MSKNEFAIIAFFCFKVIIEGLQKEVELNYVSEHIMFFGDNKNITLSELTNYN